MRNNFQLSFFGSKWQVSEREARKRYYVLKKANKCWACGREGLEVEKGHLIDKVIGGDDSFINLRPMCFECNMCKPLTGSFIEVIAWKCSREIYVQEGIKRGKPLILKNPLAFGGILAMVYKQEFGVNCDIVFELENSQTWPRLK